MIPFDRIDSMVVPLEEKLEAFYVHALTDSARSLSQVLRAKNGLNPALFYTNKQLYSTQLYDKIVARIAKLSGHTEKELRLIFKQAGLESIKDDAAIIGKLGLEVPELATSDVLTGAVNAVFARTNAVLQNLTRSIAYQSEMAFIAAVDDAYLAVSTGTLGIDQAIKQGVLRLADQGVRVLTNTGRVEQADVAIKRNIWTGINQATGDMTLALAAEAGTDLVEVSAHPGARSKGYGPMNHASWQGKVYSISGMDPKYQPLIETTGYGTGPGLLGYNCRHSLFLYFEGYEKPNYTQAELDRMNNTQVTYNGKQMDLYEATQQQRYFERGVRDWKRKQAMFESAGLGEEHQMAGVKIQEWQTKLRDFTKQTGLERRMEWEQVAGVRARRPSWGKSTMPEVKASVPVVPKYDLNTYEGVMAKFQDTVGFTKGMPDLSKLDLQTIKDITGQYEKVIDKYPQMKGKFDALEVKYIGKKQYAQTFGGSIELSKSHYINYQEFGNNYKRWANSGWSPAGLTCRSGLTHEIGHVVSNKLPRAVTPFINRPEHVASPIARQIKMELGLTKNDIVDGLSQYATKNDREFFAEAFAEYMDSPNPRPIAKRFGEILDEWMKELK